MRTGDREEFVEVGLGELLPLRFEDFPHFDKRSARM